VTTIASRYVVSRHQLAIGIEPVDAVRGQRYRQPLQLTDDRAPLGGVQIPVDRHGSGLHALRYQLGVAPPAFSVRVFDGAESLYAPSQDRRRCVPRRFTVPLRTAVQADLNPAGDRVRRLSLFPGAAYETTEAITGLRGTVTRAGAPFRWCRVEARRGTTVVGRAHGDDRGEFLLLLDSRSAGVGDLVEPFVFSVRIFGLAAPAVPVSLDRPSIDPLWDLPLEVLPGFGLADTVSTGEALPAGYSELLARNVEFQFGRLRGNEPVFAVP
jgi:hypothetical protein